MKKIVMLALAASAAFPLCAQAENFYLGGALSNDKYWASVPGASGDGGFGRRVGAKVYGGYQFTPKYALEQGYVDFRTARNTYVTNGVADPLELHAQALYLAGKATLPLNPALALHAKLGAAYRRWEVAGGGALRCFSRTTYDTRLFAGVGASFDLSRNVALTLDYERFGNTSADSGRINTLSLGARMYF